MTPTEQVLHDAIVGWQAAPHSEITLSDVLAARMVAVLEAIAGQHSAQQAQTRAALVSQLEYLEAQSQRASERFNNADRRLEQSWASDSDKRYAARCEQDANDADNALIAFRAAHPELATPAVPAAPGPRFAWGQLVYANNIYPSRVIGITHDHTMIANDESPWLYDVRATTINSRSYDGIGEAELSAEPVTGGAT